VLNSSTSAVDRVFGTRSDQTKEYKIGVCCFSSKHPALRSKTKELLAWSQGYCVWVERRVYM